MASLRLIQSHSHSHNLSDNLDFRRKTKGSARLGRGGMWVQNQRTLGERAPAALVTFAMFKKVDRALRLVRPARSHYLFPAIVYQNERSWRQNRVHGPVTRADQPILVALQLQGRKHLY